MSVARLPLDFATVQQLLRSMDSEYDQNVAKGLIGSIVASGPVVQSRYKARQDNRTFVSNP